MTKITEEDREAAQNLYREVFVILGTVNETEKTLSRVKNEATELLDKLEPIVGKRDGNEA